MKTGKELHEHALAFAYDRYPWRVTVASESYKAGYNAAVRDAEKQLAKAKAIMKDAEQFLKEVEE